MKRLIIFFAAACLLCGCAAHVGETTPDSAPPVLTDTALPASPETEAPQTESAGEGMIRVPDTQTEPERDDVYIAQGQANYSVLENDRSVRNDNGDILVNIRYDQVILDTAEENWKGINEAILSDYRDFLADMAYLNDTAPADWEAQLQSMGAVYGSFLSTRSAEVTQNSGGIFSIRMTWEWYMGGVYSREYYGLNFNLITGEPLTLAQLSGLSEEELTTQLKTIVCDQLNENRDVLLETPEEALADYTLADFSFCIDEGELVLLFPTYTFGPGVMGATVVKTGIFPQI